MGKSLSGKNLGKGFTQRKDGLYQGTYYVNGKRKFLYDKNIKRLKQLIKQKENGEDEEERTESDVTFGEMYEMWMENRVPNLGLKRTTINFYKLMYNAIKNEIKDKKIVDMDIQFCENYLNKCKEKHGTGTSIIKVLLSHVLEYSVDCGLIKESSLKDLKIAIPKKKKKINYLTINDQKIILKYEKNATYKNYMVLIINTGLRVGELIGLEIDNINLEEKYIVISKQIQTENTNGHIVQFFQDTKSYKSNRVVPLNMCAEKAIRDQLKNREKYICRVKNDDFKNLLFLSTWGTPLDKTSVNKHLSILYDKLSDKLDCEKITSHTLRHTFATNCIESDLQTRVIQELLGHSDDKITQIYAHVSKNKLRVSLNQLNSINEKLM